MRSIVLSTIIIFSLCVSLFADDSPSSLQREINANDGVISLCEQCLPQLVTWFVSLQGFDWYTPVASLAGTQWYESGLQEQWTFTQSMMAGEVYLDELVDDYYLASLCNADAQTKYNFEWSTIVNGGAPDWYQVRFELLTAQPRVNRIGPWILSIDAALRTATTAMEAIGNLVTMSQWQMGGM